MLYRNSFPESDKQDEKKSRILLRGIKSLEIGYFGDPEGRGELDWYETWDDEDVPNIIRMRIAFPEGQNRFWPELVAAPFSAFQADRE
jgi:hypothetical protein